MKKWTCDYIQQCIFKTCNVLTLIVLLSVFPNVALSDEFMLAKKKNKQQTSSSSSAEGCSGVKIIKWWNEENATWPNHTYMCYARIKNSSNETKFVYIEAVHGAYVYKTRIKISAGDIFEDQIHGMARDRYTSLRIVQCE